MKVQPSGTPDSSPSPRRSPLLSILVALNALLIGGCLALLLVSRLLKSQNDLYINAQRITEATVTSSLIEDLMLFYILCGSLLLLLLLLTGTIWAWTRTQSRFLRFGFLILILLALAIIAAVYLLGSSTGPITIPQP